MEFFADAKQWCQGKSSILRLLMWVWFIYLTIQHLRDWEYQGWMGGLNLGIHEFGHLITQGFGQFICMLSGSLVQCLIPLISFVMFYRQEDYFAFAFSFAWLGRQFV